jgi:hypothetical protein
MLTVVPDLLAALPADGPASSLIDQIVREGARRRWRVVSAQHLPALVRAGATFGGGQLGERTGQRRASGPAAAAAA